MKGKYNKNKENLIKKIENSFLLYKLGMLYIFLKIDKLINKNLKKKKTQSRSKQIVNYVK